MEDPLGAAAKLGDVPQVGNLLADGKSPIQENPEGSTALDIAAEGEQQAVAELMVQKLVTENPDGAMAALVRAIEKGHLLLVKLLLKHGVDPNTPSRDTGDYPLHTAVRRNDLTILKTLLNAGASPEVLHGLSHATPEQLAEAFYFLDAAKVLKQHKAATEKNAAKEVKGKWLNTIWAILLLAAAGTAVAVVPKGKKSKSKK